jgi:hypothetical protein
MSFIYEIDTKNFGYHTPEEKEFEEALSKLGEIKHIKSRGDGLTYVIDVGILRLPIIQKEKIKRMNGVEKFGRLHWIENPI